MVPQQHFPLCWYVQPQGCQQLGAIKLATEPNVIDNQDQGQSDWPWPYDPPTEAEDDLEEADPEHKMKSIR